jgi:hypothetical protein
MTKRDEMIRKVNSLWGFLKDATENKILSGDQNPLQKRGKTEQPN